MVIAVTMDAACVIKSFQILKNQAIGVLKVLNFESIKPFTLDNGMEGVDTGIVLGKSFFRITMLRCSDCFTVFLILISTLFILTAVRTMPLLTKLYILLLLDWMFFVLSEQIGAVQKLVAFVFFIILKGDVAYE